MIYVRVRDRVGHEFSTPIDDPLIDKGLLRVVDRKGMTRMPLPPKFKKTLPPLGGTRMRRPLMAEIPSTPADGNVKVVVATAVADPSAPTVAELEAAVDISCYLTPDGFAFTQEQATITDDRLCSRQTFNEGGRKSYTLALTGIDNTNSEYETEYNEFVETLAEGSTRVVYARYGLPYEDPFAAGQTVRSVPVRVGAKTEMAPEANSVLRAQINTFVNASSELVTIAGA